MKSRLIYSTGKVMERPLIAMRALKFASGYFQIQGQGLGT
jgi:hypothetical protein